MLRNLLIAFITITAFAGSPAAADTRGSLFVNLTTEDGHRADMALTFSGAMLERGHPVAIWLNDKGVLIASREHAGKFAAQRKTLADLMAKGATVIVCPLCMKYYGIRESDLIEGARVGNPDLTSGLLFKDDAKTLTW